jgi:hypothetical protein
LRCLVFDEFSFVLAYRPSSLYQTCCYLLNRMVSAAFTARIMVTRMFARGTHRPRGTTGWVSLLSREFCVSLVAALASFVSYVIVADFLMKYNKSDGCYNEWEDDKGRIQSAETLGSSLLVYREWLALTWLGMKPPNPFNTALLQFDPSDHFEFKN